MVTIAETANKKDSDLLILLLLRNLTLLLSHGSRAFSDSHHVLCMIVPRFFTSVCYLPEMQVVQNRCACHGMMIYSHWVFRVNFYRLLKSNCNYWIELKQRNNMMIVELICSFKIDLNKVTCF